MKTFQSALLLLTALMSTSRAQEIVYAQVGQTVTLNPPANFKSLNYYLKWTFGKAEIAWSNYLNGKGVTVSKDWGELDLLDSSVIVKNIVRKQFGTYTCEMNGKILTYKVLLLTVSAEPSSPVLPGQTVTLACGAERPNSGRGPKMHWLSPQGEKILQGTHRVNVTSQHSGQWTCVVTVDNKSDTAQISVAVVDLYSPPMEYTSRSAPLALPCSIPARATWEQIKAAGLREAHWQFFPGPKSSLVPAQAQRLFTLSLEEPVSWRAGQSRGLTPVSDFKTRNFGLARKLGGGDDRGDYVCTLNFENGQTLSRTIRVNVLEIAASPGTDLILGQHLNLTCSLGAPLTSDLHLKWISPERATLQSNYLAIPAVGLGDGGRWRCELWRNATRLTSAVITLKIEPRLSMWMLVIVCGAAAIVVLLLLLILAFILWRRRVRRVKHIRRHLCQCKNPKPKGFYRT